MAVAIATAAQAVVVDAVKLMKKGRGSFPLPFLLL